MDRLHITDLEAALNHWRAVRPAAASGALAPEVAALAEVYGRMVYQRQDEVRLWLSLTPFAKRAVWQRITQAQTAWRFNRYAERAAEAAASR